MPAALVDDLHLILSPVQRVAAAGKLQPSLFGQPLRLLRAGALESTALDEAHDLSKLAALEPDAVSFAHVDDHTRPPAEVFAIHDSFAGGAWQVANGSGGRFRRRVGVRADDR